MVSVAIPMLEYQLATVYSRWTSAGRAKALELDSILKASSIELEQVDIYNMILEEKLDLAERDAPKELAQLIELLGEITQQREKLEESKQAVSDRYDIKNLQTMPPTPV